MGFNFEEELKKLPKKPGVYIMRDDKDVILYVGKAFKICLTSSILSSSTFDHSAHNKLFII